MATKMQALILAILSKYGLEDKGTLHLHLNYSSRAMMPLTIERIHAADHGCYVYSVTHYYKQNGDMMRDPEMCFDARDWQPLYFRNDGLPIEQYVYPNPDRKRWAPKLQKSLASFAATWAQNLRDQGILDDPPRITALSHTHKLRVPGASAYNNPADPMGEPNTADVGSTTALADPSIPFPK